MIKIIEKNTEEGQYGFNFDEMIVEHQTHGRLLLVEGFSGQDELRGGMYRWSSGIAVKLQPDDTIKSLRDGEWNDFTSLYQAVTTGHDDSRPVMDWDGWAIDKIAKAAK